MAGCSLIYKNYQKNQILGVTLSKEHANTAEVQEIVKRYKNACYMIFLLFIGLSLLLLIDGISSYAEFYMLVLVIGNLFAHWLIIHHYEQKLLLIKKNNKWIYQSTKVVTVDLNVTKEKGKSSVSVIWSWGFFCLSFIPTIYLLLNTRSQGSYPLLLSLIGPLTQLSTIYLYHKMRYQHALVMSDDSETNKACARAEERINTMTATLSALTMLVFWILFSFSMIYTSNELFSVLPAVLLVTVMLIVTSWQQKSIRTIENRYFSEESLGNDGIYEQESTWKWGFYNNPSDPRIMVPKRIASMGWTINIGTPIGKVLGFGTYALILVVLLVVLLGGEKDYRIIQIGSEIKIDAAMYDMTVQKDQVVSVSVIETIPRGSRTNGYGGMNKSFGHFSLSGYGKCMLYVYNKVDRYIVIELDGSNPSYVIVNDKSEEKTDELFQSINQWLED
jgi:uncharacterized membrane protein